MSSLSKITVGVIGASGYTGAELIRLLANHPRAHIGVLAANTHADQPLSQVFPHLAALDLAPMVKTAEADWTGVDAISVARNIIGPTDGRKAAPGTIRGDYAMDIGHNIIHGSDAEETAEFELGLWFPDGVEDWTRLDETWFYE